MKRVTNLDYFVVLHDPHYFYNTYLTQVIPKAFFGIVSGENYIGIWLKLYSAKC